MKEYLVPFIAYIITIPVVYFLLKDFQLAYLVHSVIGIILLVIFWERYNLRFRIDYRAILTGVVIAVIWVVSDNYYPLLFDISFQPANMLFLVGKLVGFIFVAPLIEEIFTRDFMHRFIISPNFRKVKIGQFSWPAFIITVMFFGFSHNRWLVGIIAGIILNLLLYRTRKIESCIQAHFTANLCLAVFMITTGSWYLW